MVNAATQQWTRDLVPIALPGAGQLHGELTFVYLVRDADRGYHQRKMRAQKPQLVVFYHRNRIWIYRDEGHEKPWRVVFDGLSSPEIRDRLETGAKNTALALAQNIYFPDLQPALDKIDWRDLRT